MPRLVLVLAFAVLALALASAEWPTLQPYAETLPGSAVRFEMAPVPFRGDAPGFWISRQAVTSAEYAAYLAERDGRAAEAASRPASLTSSPDPEGGRPAAVTFAEALGYTRWLSGKTGHGFRLPSETEWEQACRAAQDAEAGRSFTADHFGGAPEWTMEAARGRTAPPHMLKGGGPADAADACAAERSGGAAAVAGFRVIRPYEAGRR